MTNESIYRIWRPDNSPWSDWAKPVIFSFLSGEDLRPREYAARDWQAPLQPDTAIIADLPGAEGVSAGIALAHAGYRPVLAYNACPYANDDSVSPDSGSAKRVRAAVVVDMSAILIAACAAAAELSSIALPPTAPPVFVLDANRRGTSSLCYPGWFDNRSFVSPSDFPSADFLRSRGISKLVLIQPEGRIAADLLPVLLSFQKDGFSIATQTPWTPWSPTQTLVRPPNLFVSTWEALRRKLAYDRNDFQGSFGAKVPPGSSS